MNETHLKLLKLFVYAFTFSMLSLACIALYRFIFKTDSGITLEENQARQDQRRNRVFSIGVQVIVLALFAIAVYYQLFVK